MGIRRRLDRGQAVIFWKQLTGLLRGGLALPDALLSLGRDSESAPFRDLMDRLRSAITEGESLSDAIGRHPRDFDHGTVACIRAGERSGDLPRATELLATHGAKTHLLWLRGRMVMTYPMILLTFTVLVTFSLARYVIPHATEVHENLGVELPWLAKTAIAALYPLNILFMVAVAVLLACFAAYRLPGAFPRLRGLLDRLLLRLPFSSRYYRALIMARFHRTLSMMLSAGVSLHEALPAAGAASGNTAMEKEIATAVDRVADGSRITDALRPGVAFTRSTLWSLRQAEERGDFGETLDGLAGYHEEVASIGASTFLTAVEPVMVVIVGILSAATIITLATPVFTTYAAIY